MLYEGHVRSSSIVVSMIVNAGAVARIVWWIDRLTKPSARFERAMLTVKRQAKMKSLSRCVWLRSELS